MKRPRVLVISSNAFSNSHNNGKTLERLLETWNTEDLAHIYFDGTMEDTDYCKKYFVISVYDATDRLLSIKKKKYIVTEENPELFNANNKAKLYTRPIKKIYKDMKETVSNDNTFQRMRINAKGRSPKSRLIELPLILQQRWIKNEIIKWINGFNPEFVFFQSTGAFLPFIIAQYIHEYFQIPLFLQILDDFSVPLYEKSLLERHIVKKYNNLLKTSIDQSSSVIAISDLMAKEYKRRFGGAQYEVYSNARDLKCLRRDQYFTENRVTFLYCGNLGHERINVLSKLGRVLDAYSCIYDKSIVLRIFSGTSLTEEQKNILNDVRCIEHKGFINADRLLQEMEAADFLLHVESFSPIYRKMVRLSISTKIGEYLSTERCIIAIGPPEVASIDYIKSKELGIVFDNENYTTDIIHKMINDIDSINIFITNAREEYEKRFAENRVNEMMDRIVSSLLEKRE